MSKIFPIFSTTVSLTESKKTYYLLHISLHFRIIISHSPGEGVVREYFYKALFVLITVSTIGQSIFAQENLFSSKFLPVVYQNNGYLTIIGEKGKLQEVSLTTSDGTSMYTTSTQKDYLIIPINSLHLAESVCFIRISGNSGSVTRKIVLQ